MKKIITALILSSICGISLAADIVNRDNISVPKDIIIIKLSHVTLPNLPKGMASENFKKEMESKFPGRVKVEIYPDNKLFKDKNEGEALELGLVNIIMPASGKVANEYKVPEMSIFDVPFLFNSDDDVKKYINSSTGQKLLNMVNEHNNNIQALAYWPYAFRVFSGPIAFKSPSDFKNYSFRIEAPSMGNFYNALHAKSTKLLPYSEVAKALKKQGEIKLDGAENSISNFLSIKLYESQKVITLSRHTYTSYICLTNKHWLNSLPNDIKEAIIQVAKNSGEVNQEVALKNESKDLKTIENQGVQIYQWTPEEKKQFKLAAIPVHEKFMKEVNKDFLLESYKAVK